MFDFGNIDWLYLVVFVYDVCVCCNLFLCKLFGRFGKLLWIYLGVVLIILIFIVVWVYDYWFVCVGDGESDGW